MDGSRSHRRQSLAETHPEHRIEKHCYERKLTTNLCNLNSFPLDPEIFSDRNFDLDDMR